MSKNSKMGKNVLSKDEMRRARQKAKIHAKARWLETKEIVNNFNKEDITIKIDDLYIGGVYILKRGEEIVYIGQSKSIYERILTHNKDKSFDSFQFQIIEDEKTRLKVERALIKKYKPVYNIVFNDNNKASIEINGKEKTRISYRKKKLAAEYAKTADPIDRRELGKKYDAIKKDKYFQQMQTAYYQDNPIHVELSDRKKRQLEQLGIDPQQYIKETYGA